MSNLEILGLFGTSMILIGYLGLQVQYFTHDNIYYDLINLFGALILAVYAYLSGTIPFVVLNVIWSLVAIKDIYFYFKKRSCVK